MSNPSVKAGLIGAGAAIVLSLLSLIPCVGCISTILGLVLYIGVGVLAAYWMEPPRKAGPAAKQGAIAGLITALVGGFTNIIVSTIRFSVAGGQAAVMRQLRQLPPEALRQLEELGIQPGAFASLGSVIGLQAVCCTLGLLLAAALGAAGGAIMASIQSGSEAPTSMEQGF